MKLLEALVLLLALGLFVWWQLRDLRMAREHTKRLRERQAAAAAQAQASAADHNPGCTENHRAPQGDTQPSERVAPDTRPPQ